MCECVEMVRLPVELSAVETMMPLHSAVASARLTSSLSIESLNWGLVPQGALLFRYLINDNMI